MEQNTQNDSESCYAECPAELVPHQGVKLAMTIRWDYTKNRDVIVYINIKL